ncbi:MAG: ABC transporter permease subunit [Campylobacteraceae bacterium]|jgi:sulfate transport system permease protein|nr:ABC transporter permease subunit [Campylobacteraceae bacterium]
MSDTIKSKIKILLLSISALTAIYGLFAIFTDIRAFIVLILTSAIFFTIASNAQKEFSDIKKPNAKIALLALIMALICVYFVHVDIKIAVTLFLISGAFTLASLNQNALTVSQIIINIVLFSILFFILTALYQNPNHALAWVSLIIFTLISALANKVGYKKSNAKLPGFNISLGLSLTYMSLLILIPLSALALYSTQITAEKFLETLTDQRIIAALKVSFGASFIAALINCFFGLIIAWILTRYDFIGKRIVDSLIDLPFAVPTAVAGISLAYIFSPNGVLGEFLQALTEKLHSLAPYFHPEKCAVGEKCFANFLETIDLNVAYSKIGIILALVFIGLPFVVRTVQPVIEELDKELEEAASSLGANFYQIFSKVIFPAIYPALLTGFALAFARGLGEYGSVIFIASNIPYESEIVPLLIVKKLMQFDYVGASVIGVIMLIAAFVLLLLINFLQSFAKRRKRGI